MSAHDIPTRSRLLVKARQKDQCLRCGASGRVVPMSWHHRRSKSVVDDHRHCPCNGILLCGDGVRGCHGWAHSSRHEATSLGLIVPRHETFPGSVAVWSELDQKLLRLDCLGGVGASAA